MTSCAGPYTRVFFAAADAAPAQDLWARLDALGVGVALKALPDGQSGLDDFNLDFDIPGDEVTWELRGAKFLGPKKLIGLRHVYEMAFRKRIGGETVWEGFLFSDKLAPLAGDVAAALPQILNGEDAPGLIAQDDAFARRIELCTGITI